jgi:hypothetical protein
VITLPVGYGMGAPVRRGLVISAKLVVDGRVTTNPVRPGHPPGGFPAGTIGSGGPTERGVPGPRPPGLHNAFDFVLRGYDRNQVDARISELVTQLATATERIQSTAAQLAAEQRRAEHAERQLQALQSSTPAASTEDAEHGFGYRAERLLRMAEAEANEIRGSAIKEAADIVERARATAEQHRHEIEQNLILRATTLDQQANEVAAALREREEAAASELASARTEAEAVRAAARREMEQARKNVEVVARDVRAQAERWAEQHRTTAASEVARLVGLRDTMHRDLGALSETLLAAVRAEEERTAQAGQPTPPEES